MLPVIAIIGRPNVGKSTLFNRLTKSRDALVADLPGLTRDRQYGEAQYDERKFLLVDTGGIGFDAEGLDSLMLDQTKLALEEADAILFVVDGRSGRTAADEAITQQLRMSKKPVYLVMNKTEGIDPMVANAEFHALGIGNPIAISAAHGDGIHSLMSKVLRKLPQMKVSEEEIQNSKGIKVAIIGRPNVGKSTLVNRVLGEERVVVYDEAGTTRDSIFIPFERQGKDYTIIDTAGVRRKSRISEKIEKFSVTKSLQAIESANVVVFVIDARTGIVEHDLRLLGFVLDTGKALVIAINKWDGMELAERNIVKKELDRRLTFIDFARIHLISALHGTGVGDLFKSIEEAYSGATKKLSTPMATKILEKAVKTLPTPMVRGRRVKLRYAHIGGHNPPLIIIHGNQTDALPMNYRRYLQKTFRQELKIMGTPIKIEFKSSENPYKDKKNALTERQIRRKKRLFRNKK